MTARTLPTTDGWWWADVDGDRRVLEVWPHADGGLWCCPNAREPRQCLEVDDERLVDGVDGFDTSDGERIPEVVWLAPAAPLGSVPPEVHARAVRGVFDRTLNYGDTSELDRYDCWRDDELPRLRGTLAGAGLTEAQVDELVYRVSL